MDKMEFKTRDEISSLVPHKGKMLLERSLIERRELP